MIEAANSISHEIAGVLDPPAICESRPRDWAGHFVRTISYGTTGRTTLLALIVMLDLDQVVAMCCRNWRPLHPDVAHFRMSKSCVVRMSLHAAV